MTSLLCNWYFKKQDEKKIKEQEIGLLGGSIPSDHNMFINKGHDDEMEIFCYKRCRIKTALTYLLFILTVGVARLIYHWVPQWYLYSTSVRCKVAEAEKILVLELYNGKHKIYHVEDVTILTVDKIKELMNEHDESFTTFPVHFDNGVFRDVEKLLTFCCKKVIYIWDDERQDFIKLSGLDKGVSLHELRESKGLAIKDQFLRKIIFGPNEIEVKVSSITKLLFLEVLNPYYIFQILSFALWFADNYYVYATTIILMSAASIVTSVRQTRKTEKKLKNTVHSVGNCVVRRNHPSPSGGFVLRSEEVLKEDLVPGDVIEISDECVMHCDAVLLSGTCIVNESMLTGESVPVTKNPLSAENAIYDSKEHARHTLFCGTEVIQSRNVNNQTVLAVVIRTGYSTTKGSLVRSIQFPPPVDFKFEKDSYKFIGVLAVVAFMGFIYTIISKVLRGIKVGELILEACDLITIVVPPALPTAMTIGQLSSQKRLEKKDIFCISPRTINVAGSLNCVCFDKTGTLTEDGLDLDCIVPVENKKIQTAVTEVGKMSITDFICGMVCCHSLKIVKEKIVGDPLDLKMFNSTNWVFEEIPSMNITAFKSPIIPGSEGHELEIGLFEEFPFSSSSQRMGVIVRRIKDDVPEEFEFFCKGSPEKILDFVRPDSVPDDFQDVLDDYTQKGYRVIALAHKRLNIKKVTKVKNLKREDLESNLTLLGLMVFENRLKPITKQCIKTLNDANVRVIMVTGDNILTALSVAKKCDMITPGQSVITVNADNNVPANLYYTLTETKGNVTKDVSILSNSITISMETEETVINSNSKDFKKAAKQNYNNYRFAMTGKTWAALKEYHPELLQKIVARGTIFARMSPENKQQLVQELQGIGYIVAMCGDGANDCGALKAAHTGVSLSEAESSVASPFTSTKPDISCVIEVIREGRAGLVTSFGIFKYMAAYSLCQFTSVLILYSMDANLTDFEFLFIDLGIIATFTYFFGKTESFDGKLVKETPLSSLISIIPILSLFCQMFLVVVFQSASFFHLKSMDWYVPFNATEREDKDDNSSLENYAVYTISSFQYVILAVVFSKGKPYRKSINTNYGFIIGALVLTVACVYMAVSPCTALVRWFQLEMAPDMWFRWILVIYAVCNFVLSIFVENVVIDNYLFKKYHKNDESKRKYLEIEKKLKEDTKWPVLSDYTSETSPTTPLPKTTVDIVYEKENFDKNHVLNKLYNPSNSQTSINKLNNSGEVNGYVIGMDVSNLSKNVENGFYSQDDLYTSLPSQNYSSQSETFKSFSNGTNFDLANSHENIDDLPYDDVDIGRQSVSPSHGNCLQNGDASNFNLFGSSPKNKVEVEEVVKLNNITYTR